MAAKVVLRSLLVGAVTVVVALTTVAWASAAGAAYPPPPTGISLSASTGVPGSSVTVTGLGCPASSPVSITLQPGGAQLAVTTANSQGHFSVTVVIPSATVPGPHQIVATCGNLVQSARFVVLPPVVSRPLPLTGFETRAWLAASLAFVVAGTALVLSVRKRRHRRVLGRA